MTRIEYYIFGEKATRLMETGNKAELISRIKEGSIDYALYMHSCADSTANILLEFKGWGDFCSLTKTEYQQLTQVHNEQHRKSKATVDEGISQG